MGLQVSGHHIEKWALFELTLNGPAEGNPFMDVTIGADFTYEHRTVHVEGFYDGEGVYRIRFMPDEMGNWHFHTVSNVPELDAFVGEFECIAPSSDNHGPVRVHDTYHFEYADGTSYNQIGTTCYVWNHQGDELEELTLATLRKAPFNKLRMCVFPHDYTFNRNTPLYQPFEGTPEDGWDFTRFNPRHFRHLEQRVDELLDLGIEADVILFHPYDRWGYSEMDAQTDDRYLRYVVARLSAYRNVWWSMANEFDMMESKDMA